MDPQSQSSPSQPGQVIMPSGPSVAPPPQPTIEPPAPIQTPPPAAAPPTDQPPVASDPNALTWQASEYVHHDKRTAWHLGLFAIIAVLIAVAVVTHQWFSIGVFIVMAIALVVYGNKQPRVLNYAITDTGIEIDGKSYPFETFKSFSVIQDVAWHVIDLEPTKRFMPRLTILFEDSQHDAIVQALAAHLPEEDRQPDLIERLARYLKF